MNRRVKAMVRFHRPVPGSDWRYSTAARVQDRTGRWADEMWSIVLQVNGAPDEQGYAPADAFFLAESAPHALMTSGNRFEMFEGKTMSAEGYFV